MSLNKKKCGDRLEEFISETFHQNGIPLLIAADYLRQHDCGQIDLARLIKESNEWLVEIVEVKKSLPENTVSQKQKRRLQNSALLIGEVLDVNVQLIYAGSLKDLLPNE